MNSCASECRYDAFLDILYWHASEIAPWSQSLTNTSPPSIVDFHSVTFGWDPGVRAGVGYKMNHDDWDTQFYYTWFQTSASDSIPLSSDNVLSIFIGAGLSVFALYKTANVQWNIDFNMFDWDLGRSLFVNKTLSFRPFLGIKGGWIHQRIDTHWENPDFLLLDISLVADEDLENNFWGVGPKMGVSSQWNFFKNRRNTFGLFGDFQGAFQWGHWSFKDHFQNNLSEVIPCYIEPKDLGTLMFGVTIGFAWDIACNTGIHVIARLSYEIQDWINQYQIFEAANAANRKSLYLQGGVLDLRCDF